MGLGQSRRKDTDQEVFLRKAVLSGEGIQLPLPQSRGDRSSIPEGTAVCKLQQVDISESTEECVVQELEGVRIRRGLEHEELVKKPRGLYVKGIMGLIRKGQESSLVKAVRASIELTGEYPEFYTGPRRRKVDRRGGSIR